MLTAGFSVEGFSVEGFCAFRAIGCMVERSGGFGILRLMIYILH